MTMTWPVRQSRRRPWDLIVACVLYLFVLLIGAIAALYTLGFALISESCAKDGCDPQHLIWGMTVSWGGTLLALIGTPAELVVATRRQQSDLWIRPAIAAVVIVLSFVCGMLMVLL
ncbi:hypothetical protein [Nocardia sp. NPDC057668]|uniref:hypothetical protein n=1 Tax=Nocardia sp. NPDC057668 TaxID=3346202 RepID=UPI0036711034